MRTATMVHRVGPEFDITAAEFQQLGRRNFEGVCIQCTLIKARHLLEAGICEDCR